MLAHGSLITVRRTQVTDHWPVLQVLSSLGSYSNYIAFYFLRFAKKFSEIRTSVSHTLLIWKWCIFWVSNPGNCILRVMFLFWMVSTLKFKFLTLKRWKNVPIDDNQLCPVAICDCLNILPATFFKRSMVPESFSNSFWLKDIRSSTFRKRLTQIIIYSYLYFQLVLVYILMVTTLIEEKKIRGQTKVRKFSIWSGRF